ncbi:MAG: bacterioferritin [Acidobacteria bacterium 13_1_40CM_2_60_7]|nr:MAG: bacterioferritin [Acidobacteria bacterium 13_1_40CM_2_60_7]
MKGNAEVLEALSDMLKEELGAINQYFLHAEMCENWGYKRLAELTKKQAIGEMKHAEALIERILFLEGLPKMNEIGQINIGKDVPGQLKNDLALEKGAVAAYNKAVEVCRKAADNATADFLKEILKDEEEHVDYLETQLSLIEQLTLPIYLTEQMKG